MLVDRERQGVLPAAEPAEAEGIALDRLAGLQWVAFPRSDSPAWCDELTAILPSHGLDPGGHRPRRGSGRSRR
ncbi:hypothetical protein [Streptomyces glomeratus]|uniref:Uncharacterized protein n=1 Tax=Streptomyces glomeratus TaxID=284452 RepID=A0ABP6LW76_9ACTN|nr:hypothetical protein [Streptomyces glomeratus]MCF1510121.1 hypothetical protein [Streptomyces glomeratus]